MERYKQQIILPEFGIEGQQRLSNASVLIIGAGGLGLIVSSYLVSMGIGNVGICDFDKIEESNLHRQFCYTPNEVGQNKATVLTEKLRKQNPAVDIEDYVFRIEESNIQTVAEKYQVICDCTDQSGSRILINNYCKKFNKPLVHGAVSDWQGYITVFNHEQSFGLDDLFDFTEYYNSQTCSIAGVNSAVCGLIGSYMVNETIKIILELDNVLEGEILYINSLNNLYRTIKIKRSANSSLGLGAWHTQ